MRRAAAAVTLVVVAGLTAGAAAPQAAPLPSAPACPIFPAGNVWNQDISALPVASDSDTLITKIGVDTGLHPDFGSYSGLRHPLQHGRPAQRPKVTVRFDYSSQSDNVGYPIPRQAADRGRQRPPHADRRPRHLQALRDVERAAHQAGLAGRLRARSGDMTSNALRPDGWTSADAAGLPILPGLVRYPEVAAGVIDHALRFTAPETRDAHIYPARHDAGSGSSASLPPMGLRVRLKASFDLSQLSPQARVIAVALQHYGMILADNGSPWYVSGASNPPFNDDDLRTLNRITGRDLEVVDTSGLVNTPDRKGQRQSPQRG